MNRQSYKYFKWQTLIRSLSSLSFVQFSFLFATI